MESHYINGDLRSWDPVSTILNTLLLGPNLAPVDFKLCRIEFFYVLGIVYIYCKFFAGWSVYFYPSYHKLQQVDVTNSKQDMKRNYRGD